MLGTRSLNVDADVEWSRDDEMKMFSPEAWYVYELALSHCLDAGFVQIMAYVHLA